MKRLKHSKGRFNNYDRILQIQIEAFSVNGVAERTHDLTLHIGLVPLSVQR